jgi:hypothetical protein
VPKAKKRKEWRRKMKKQMGDKKRKKKSWMETGIKKRMMNKLVEKKN